jgi:hypothetical protein
MQQNQPNKQPSRQAMEVATKILAKQAQKLAEQRKIDKPQSNLNEQLTRYTADEIRQHQDALDE